jgi:hypothetical protein
VDDRYTKLDQAVPAAGLLGYLNFSDGRPDARWQKQLNDAYAWLAGQGEAAPWQALTEWLKNCLDQLQTSGAAAFRNVEQAHGVLLLLPEVLSAYRRHHADLLFHRSDGELFQPFFLARVFEAILAQGPPWDAEGRIVRGTLQRLNDFVGHRPIAILETRRQGEPYEHERVRPIPLYIRDAGVAWGRYQQLVQTALDILAAAEPAVQHEAGFEPRLLDELALDPRAYDFNHPANKRSNYVFGEWDPHHLDDQGRYRRYVARQVTLDALLERVQNPGSLDPQELLYEAAAVLAGTVLMAMGVSGPSPTAYDSSTTLHALMPRIARYRDAFYVHLLQALPEKHATRLRQEQQTTRQPFGTARQHLNQYLARQRAAQMQQRFLALLFAEMGYPDASQTEAARIPAASVRMLSEILSLLTTGQLCAERGELAEAAALLPEVDNRLHLGIACGALADPWNILGFQGLYPLSPAREDSVRDTRLDELVHVVDYALTLHARLSSEAAATGKMALVETVAGSMKRLATWWDQFATIDVSDVRRVSGREALASARHVGEALSHWHARGEAAGDLAFWREHLDNFRSPKAFALVVDALLRKHDYRAAMALIINWLGQAEQVPLEDGTYSFHALALRWMLGHTHKPLAPALGERGWGEGAVSQAPAPPTPLPRSGGEGSPGPELVRKLFDYLEANAEEYWQVPAPAPAAPKAAEDEEENLFGAAYEGVTYRDSADDDQEGEVLGDEPVGDEFDLAAESETLGKRLRFLSTVARLWQVAARREGIGREALTGWLATARDNQRKLLDLLDTLHDHAVPQPLGSFDSLVEYDRRRGIKEQLLYTAIATCLDTFLAVGSLRGALGAEDSTPDSDRPAWEPLAIQLERALYGGDDAAARSLLPRFLKLFAEEPFLAAALSEGAEPRQVLRVRIAQTILRALAAYLPRLGLLRETYQVLQTAFAMERMHRPSGRGITEFNNLFQTAYQSVVESIVESARDWAEEHADEATLVELLEALSGPFLLLWIEHSQTLHVSVLEGAPNGDEWQRLVEFIKTYGGDLFSARFMTLANLRGVLHRGIGSWLDDLAANADPLHSVRLLDDLGEKIARDDAIRFLHFTLQAIIENYEEYKDYNTTTAQSDYGENLHVLLDYLRVRVSYDRQAWQFRPLVLAHEVMARKGRGDIAVMWQEAFTHATQEAAAGHLDALTQLERTHGVRLGTIRDRLSEEFVKPLAVDRAAAFIEPAMDQARQREEPVAFVRLQKELQTLAARPVGVGLDVPQWLRQLEAEVRRVRAAHTAVAVQAGQFFQLPRRSLTYEEVQRQVQEWDTPSAEE